MVILGRNVRTRYGELDLVARDGDTVVFVEVRSRTQTAHGDPLETVSRAKQGRVTRMARWYLAAHHLPADTYCRFDVVGVVFAPGCPPQVTHVVNAFWA
jgi:putative endonuclease